MSDMGKIDTWNSNHLYYHLSKFRKEKIYTEDDHIKLKRKLTLTIVVIILALMSTVSITITAETYLEVARATQKMEAQLINVEIKENTIFLTFRFNNESNLNINLINVQFNLYCDRTFIGNYSMRENTVLGPGNNDIVVTVEVDPYYVVKAIGYGYASIESFVNIDIREIEWFMRGGAVIELPFEEATITIKITEYWVTT